MTMTAQSSPAVGLPGLTKPFRHGCGTFCPPTEVWWPVQTLTDPEIVAFVDGSASRGSSNRDKHGGVVTVESPPGLYGLKNVVKLMRLKLLGGRHPSLNTLTWATCASVGCSGHLMDVFSKARYHEGMLI